MNEPELASGDSGEWVLQLQTRLHALGRYDGALDGTYGEQTAASVSALQEEQGLPADGTVGALTWAAIGEAEVAAGLAGHDAVAETDGQLQVGALSEDHQWQWDGEQWQPKEQQLASAVHDDQAGGHVSADGQWLWDGTRWQPVR